MDFEKLTNKSKELIQDVINLAAKYKHQYISTEHLLKGLLEIKDSQVRELLQKAGSSELTVASKVDEALAKIPAVEGASVQSLMNQEFTRVMMEAESLADKAGDKFVTIERILQALVMTSGTKAYDILKSIDIVSALLYDMLLILR